MIYPCDFCGVAPCVCLVSCSEVRPVRSDPRAAQFTHLGFGYRLGWRNAVSDRVFLYPPSARMAACSLHVVSSLENCHELSNCAPGSGGRPPSSRFHCRFRASCCSRQHERGRHEYVEHSADVRRPAEVGLRDLRPAGAPRLPGFHQILSVADHGDSGAHGRAAPRRRPAIRRSRARLSLRRRFRPAPARASLAVLLASPGGAATLAPLRGRLFGVCNAGIRGKPHLPGSAAAGKRGRRRRDTGSGNARKAGWQC